MDEIESLTTNLSRKIWQKLVIVHSLMEKEQAGVLQVGQSSGQIVR